MSEEMKPRRGGRRLVLAAHPSAEAERHTTNGREVYYLVRINDAGPSGRSPRHNWTGEGDTEAQAWNDAAERLGLFATPVEYKP